MKKIYLIITFLTLFILSCSPKIDTANLTLEERFKVAREKYEDNDIDEALNDLQALILQNRASSVADDAQYYLGLCRFKKREFILSANEFSILIRDYPTSPFVKDAQFMLANSFYELSPHYSLDQKFTVKAIEEFQAFIDIFPTEKKVAEAEDKIKELNDKLAHKIYNSAIIYDKMDYYRSSLSYIDLLLEKYPDSKYVPEALLKKANILISKKRIPEALDVINKFMSKYSTSEFRAEFEKLKNQISANK